MANIPTNQWDAKWLREGAFMPFGSMCNAYGQVYGGQKGVVVPKETFFADMETLFELSNKFVEQNFDKVEQMKESSEEQI